MNFKEVRLAGFKSFADKTSIKFEDGVTCIVGPNGCGKSNVADAVRWVLGEQSAKTLRGSNMQDVIFAGTETRRQLSFCEVTLVFDNSKRIFDIEYEEVAMTRRLYRSGESEYLLNMQPCRLKDIVALLHGVGIGKEGYSIIGQGKVAQIMNSKPEDRRTIFEEATGVIKFKTQKGEIERKLESAKENLTVFVQRMDEAERQLRPLEKQAETARKYREYAADLKYEEVNAYLVRSDSFEQDSIKYRGAIAQAEAELAGIDARLALADGEEEAGRARISQADERLRKLHERLLSFEVGMANKSGDAKVLGERIGNYKRSLSSAAEEIAVSQKRMKDIDAAVQGGMKKAESGERRVKEIEKECAALTGKLTEADARVAAYERLSDAQRASEISSVENLADARANVGSLTARRDAAQDRIGEVREAIQKAEGRRKEFCRQLEECRKEKKACTDFLDSKPQREEELLGIVGDLARSSQKLSEEIVNCNTSIANFTNNRDLYIGLKNRFDGYRESVRRLQLDAKDNAELAKRIKGTIADIVRTDKQYEVAIETAFGAAMQHLVTATGDDARYLIQYLKDRHAGVATFLPIETMRPHANTREVERALNENGALGLADELVRYDEYYDNVIKNLLGNTLICDNIMNATRIMKKYPRVFRIITLEGDIIATNGSMTGGSQRKDSGNLLAGERKIKECEENIARKKSALEKFRAALATCEKELEEARADFEAFRVKVQEETAHFAAVAQKEIALEGLVETAETDSAEYAALLERLMRQASDLETEVLSSAENEELLNKIRMEAASETQLRATEIEKIKEEREALAKELNDLRIEAASVSSARAAEEENLRRLKEEKDSLIVKIDETRAGIRNMEAQIEALKAEEEKVSLTEEEQLAVAKIREEIAAVEAQKKEENEKQSRLAEEKRGLIAKQTLTTEKKHTAENEITRAETTLENMRQRLDEMYGLTYESAQALRDPAYDFSQANTNINSLRHKIAALGNVNMNAVEDYDELLARYNEMQTQKDDLDKGIEDLTGVLNELRETMQKQFDTGFQEINANFTQIFKELFGGGRAEMQLDYTDCEDPLEAGVEIVACPPGKKLTKISLLSGGEQAFTAIAILFAILKSRPMPFCILDEIEAALDEANVDRFAKYLKKFSKDTQFIVITHRKPTMAQADVLFGVTMEEKGVSKIVSVKLSEVESRLGGDTIM